jgi:arabinogalactan endo-1,4-beta-galactosidase
MATFGSSNIRFRVIFNMSAKTCTFLDLIGTNYYAIWGVALTNIRAKVTMMSPSGTQFAPTQTTPIITGRVLRCGQ